VAHELELWRHTAGLIPKGLASARRAVQEEESAFDRVPARLLQMLIDDIERGYLFGIELGELIASLTYVLFSLVASYESIKVGGIVPWYGHLALEVDAIIATQKLELQIEPLLGTFLWHSRLVMERDLVQVHCPHVLLEEDCSLH